MIKSEQGSDYMKIADFLKSENIFEFSAVPFSELRVIDERRVERMGFEPKTAVVFLMPYYMPCEETNISCYAHSRDYHFFVKELTLRARQDLECEFACFADTSPVDEVGAALISGLGCVGLNGLIINERYGSYVFVGEFFFPEEISESFFEGAERKNTRQKCLECGACLKACPTGGIKDKGVCVSYINQKKKIDEKDIEIIKKSELVWGCDECQKICPMNCREETPIEFFRENRVEIINREVLDKMLLSGEFEKRAYAWRGEKVIRRNVDLLDK